MTWVWFALAAYWIGHIIYMMEIRAEHPGWHLIPSAFVALTWPYLTARRVIDRFRVR